MAKQIISKRCSKCKEIKPLSEFYKNCSRKDSHQAYCKVCGNKHTKEYRQSERGKEANRRGARKYRSTTKGKAYQKQYEQSKKGKARYKRFEQSEKGKAHKRRVKKRYNIRYPEKRKAINAVTYAIKKNQLPRPDFLQCHYYLQNPDCEKQAKEYHHHKGYAPEHWLDVIPVCIPCHNKLS